MFATFAIHEPFVYVEPQTWVICGESCTHGNKRILEDQSKRLSLFVERSGWRANRVKKWANYAQLIYLPRHSSDLVSREVLTAREVEHVKAPNSLDTASIAAELRQ